MIVLFVARFLDWLASWIRIDVDGSELHRSTPYARPPQYVAEAPKPPPAQRPSPPSRVWK